MRDDTDSIRFGDIFRFKGLLGQGTFGVVMMVQDKIFDRSPTPLDGDDSKRETYALKIINKRVLHPEEIKIIRGESKILKSLVGLPNVV